MFAKRSNLQVAHISLSLKKKNKLKKQKTKKSFSEQEHSSKGCCALSHSAERAACLDKKKRKCLKAANRGGGIGKFWEGKGSTNVLRCLDF